MWVLRLNPGPLEEQLVLLTAEPSLQLLGRPLLKGLWHAASSRVYPEKSVAKLCFLVFRISFQALTGFKWI